MSKGIEDFKNNLEALRKLVPVVTICMHGSPMSKYDSKDLWKIYNYKDYNLIGEPYFDVNFNKVFFPGPSGPVKPENSPFILRPGPPVPLPSGH